MSLPDFDNPIRDRFADISLAAFPFFYPFPVCRQPDAPE
jgi:hypothetical protein